MIHTHEKYDTFIKSIWIPENWIVIHYKDFQKFLKDFNEKGKGFYVCDNFYYALNLRSHIVYICEGK